MVDRDIGRGKGAEGTQAIRRAAAVLQRIARVSGDKPPTLSEISASEQLSRSTAHRILKSLVDTGLATYDASSRTYGIGLLAYELGLAVTDAVIGFAKWQMAVDRIAARTQATTYLMRRSGIEAVCVYKADGVSLVRVMPVEVGQRRFLGVGAGATALLAVLDDPTVDRIVSAITPELSRFAKLDPQMIADAVADTRRTGFSESHGQVYNSVFGLGTVVPSANEIPELAISIAAHENDVSPQRIADWKRIISDELQALTQDAGAKAPAPV